MNRILFVAVLVIAMGCRSPSSSAPDSGVPGSSIGGDHARSTVSAARSDNSRVDTSGLNITTWPAQACAHLVEISCDMPACQPILTIKNRMSTWSAADKTCVLSARSADQARACHPGIFCRHSGER